MTDPTTLLHLGTDRYLLRACRRHNIPAVAVCGAGALDVGVRMPEDVPILAVDSQQSLESVLGAVVRAGMDDGRFAAVHTTDEFSLVTAAAAADVLGARGMDARVALRFRDKAVQKATLREAGMRVADVTVIDDVRQLSAADALAADCMVLKPIAGAATQRTTLIRSPAELDAAAAQHRANPSPARTFLLEECLDGDEWYADGVVYDGEILFYALATYEQPCLTSIREQAPLTTRRFDPDADAWAYERADQVIPAAIATLGLTDGVFHMELFHDPSSGQVIFSECAARRGGILIQEEVLYKFNVDLAECALLCALGRRPDLDVKVRPDVVGGAFLPMRPGVVISSPSAAELQKQPGVLFARMDRPEGAQIPAQITDAIQRMGQILVAADTAEDYARRVADVRSWYDGRLLVAPPFTSMRELRSWHQEHWIDSDFGYSLFSV